MNDEEYIAIQRQLLCFAGIIKDMPITEFLERINHCETVAPIIDPTLYIAGIDKLSSIKKIAEGARSFQKAVVES